MLLKKYFVFYYSTIQKLKDNKTNVNNTVNKPTEHRQEPLSFSVPDIVVVIELFDPEVLAVVELFDPEVLALVELFGPEVFAGVELLDWEVLVVETVSGRGKTLVRLSSEPAVAYIFGVILRMRQAI